MRAYIELSAADFPGVHPEGFEIWKAAAAAAQRRMKALLIFLVILNAVLLVAVQALLLGGLPLFAVLFFIWRKPRRLAREIGLTDAMILAARKRVAPAGGDGIPKKCPQCAEWIKLEALVCRYCGCRFDAVEVKQEMDGRVAAFQAEAAEREARERERAARAKLTRVKIWLYVVGIVHGIFLSLTALGIAQDPKAPAALAPIFFGICALISGVTVVAGWAVGRRKPWGRRLAIGTGVFWLIGFPLGTIAGLYTISALRSVEARKAFAGPG